MSNSENPASVSPDVVVRLDYTLTVAGEIVDSTQGESPLEYLHGHDNIISGLESELDGLKVGDRKEVVVSPTEGYGAFDPRLIVNVPREEIPDQVPVEVGTELQVKDQDGNISFATITKIEGDDVQMDLNHPLAGKELHFAIQIAGLRKPTAEELAHGHVHSHDHPH